MSGFTQTQVSVGGVGAARNWGDNYEVLGTSNERLTDLETTGAWQAHISPLKKNDDDDCCFFGVG